MDHKWKQLIFVVNFLFGLRVNEIPNKTFMLDSYQPIICSVVLREELLAGGNSTVSKRPRAAADREN